jgi:glycine cleavage system transcriptional repressor
MSAQTFSVLTVIGPDRIGIAEDIARLVAGQGGNIEESKMAVLGGEFAAIALICMPAASLEAFPALLKSREPELNLAFSLKATTEPRPMALGRSYLLETASLDSPGIVQAVTAVLKLHGINIEELETETQPAPWTGTPMFRMRATLILGSGVSAAQLKADLARLEGERDLDISLRPA